MPSQTDHNVQRLLPGHKNTNVVLKLKGVKSDADWLTLPRKNANGVLDLRPGLDHRSYPGIRLIGFSHPERILDTAAPKGVFDQDHTAYFMPQSLSKVIIHVVFSTKDRTPFLRDKELKHRTHAFLGGICKQQGCIPIKIGGVEDHVHILATLSRTTSQADLVKELKRASAIWIKALETSLSTFAWQAGYGVFSIGQSQIEESIRYIDNQEEHHRKVSFRDEFRRFLEKYHVEYDETFVWD